MSGPLVAGTGAALRNFVNGAWREARSGTTSAVIDPSTGQTYMQAPVSNAADVDEACRAAEAAFATWRDATPADRSRALLRFADALEAHAEEFVQAECRNTGKPLELTRTEELPPSVDQLRFFAGAARMLDGRSAGEYLAGHTSWIRREPIGVVAQVTPWNYPLMMAIWKIGPALAAGNTIVLKPSDTTPVTSVMLAELAAEVYPPGVFNVICGDRDTGRELISHPVPQLVAITGSVRAGREVATTAASDIKRVHLELGGKAPVVVFDDVDVAKVAEGIVGAGYFNAGQDCTAATRVLAAPGVHADLVDALTEQAAATPYGLPDNVNVNTCGRAPGGAGFFFPPTVVSGVAQTDELAQSEVFGPVITVQRFDDEDQAVTWANGVEYGLASSVWTKDHGRALRMSRRLDFGVVWINTHIPIVAEMPHGGFKHSGYGKDLSLYGFEDYTRIKHVMSNYEAFPEGIDSSVLEGTNGTVTDGADQETSE
jgi:betaine-aldehyde dehydrogenase